MRIAILSIVSLMSQATHQVSTAYSEYSTDHLIHDLPDSVPLPVFSLAPPALAPRSKPATLSPISAASNAWVVNASAVQKSTTAF
jgi:hypothetical protein